MEEKRGKSQERGTGESTGSRLEGPGLASKEPEGRQMPSWLLALSGEPGQAQVLTSDLGGRGTKEPGQGVTELLLAPGAKLKGRKKEGGSALSKACPQAPAAFTLGWGV